MTTDRTDHIATLTASIPVGHTAVAEGEGDPARLQMHVRELADQFLGNIVEVALRLDIDEDEVRAILSPLP
jgi:hypothetical protein